MKEKFRQFMVGRYGTDQLTQFLIRVELVLVVLSLFRRNAVISTAIFALIIVIYMRMFSKDYAKRYAENQAFLSLKQKVISKLTGWKYIREQKKLYRIYTCPTCKQKIRIPKGKGNIMVRCPKCYTEFAKKS